MKLRKCENFQGEEDYFWKVQTGEIDCSHAKLTATVCIK